MIFIQIKIKQNKLIIISIKTKLMKLNLLKKTLISKYNRKYKKLKIFYLKKCINKDHNKILNC